MANVLPEVQADKMIQDKTSEWETDKEQLKTAQKETYAKENPKRSHKKYLFSNSFP